MMLRSGWVALGVATAVSFAAGLGFGVGAKRKAFAAPPAPPAAPKVESARAEDPAFKQKVLPLVQKYCLGCHNANKAAGGLTLEGYVSEAHARKDRKTWAAIEHVIAAGEMPPKNKPQPTKDEKEFLITWIETALTKIDCTAPKDPGRVTLRRLNRAEYNNTVRDLCGVDFQPADDFPADDVGYGFDNIGDVLSLQPILVEKYLVAADKVLDQALKIPPPAVRGNQIIRAQGLQSTPRSAKIRDANGGSRRITFTTEGSAYVERLNFPAEGDYVFRLRAYAVDVGGPPKATLRVAGKDIQTVTVTATGKPGSYEMRGHIPLGEHRLSVAFVNPHTDPQAKGEKDRTLTVEAIEVDGPINPVPPPLADSVKRVLGAVPPNPSDKLAAARTVLAGFARRAYRRPAKPAEVDRLVKLFQVADGQGDPFATAIRLPLKAVLVSPNFLYRVEDDPPTADAVRTVSDFEFATRLSYFLWSTMPDEELFGLAAKGELRKPAVLAAQLKRMLADPKAKALGQNFAGQWLQLRDVATLAPDRGYFPEWDNALKAAVAREPAEFFEYVAREDRPVTDFLDADYTFVNERLAKHYGIPGVSGPEFRKVKFPDDRRGGVVTMASTLLVTSNPTRTSPVKRGKWILENILGTPPPPPAPDVPELPPTGQLKGTLRQQMEQHRENPSCAVCHAKLDPLGFGLENFNAIGGWRLQDNRQPIDPSGVLPDGSSFRGPADMRKVLLKKSDLFRRCLAEKLLTFALGRGLEYYDKCAVDEIVKKTAAGGDRFTALVAAVVESDPFQKRKGKRSE